MSNRAKRRRSGEDAQSPSEVGRASSHEALIEAGLRQLGLLPTAADPVFYRGLGKSGFGLFLYLETGLDLQTLGQLADSRDRAALLRSIVAEE
jgi:hypothetical protein